MSHQLAQPSLPPVPWTWNAEFVQGICKSLAAALSCRVAARCRIAPGLEPARFGRCLTFHCLETVKARHSDVSFDDKTPLCLFPACAQRSAVLGSHTGSKPLKGVEGSHRIVTQASPF